MGRILLTKLITVRVEKWALFCGKPGLDKLEGNCLIETVAWKLTGRDVSKRQEIRILPAPVLIKSPSVHGIMR